MESERNNQKREEILLVQVLGRESKMKLGRIVLESPLAVTGLEIPRQLRLASREMQGAAINSCMHVDGSLELGDVFFLGAVIGMCNPRKQHILPLARSSSFCRQR